MLSSSGRFTKFSLMNSLILRRLTCLKVARTQIGLTMGKGLAVTFKNRDGLVWFDWSEGRNRFINARGLIERFSRFSHVRLQKSLAFVIGYGSRWPCRRFILSCIFYFILCLRKPWRNKQAFSSKCFAIDVGVKKDKRQTKWHRHHFCALIIAKFSTCCDMAHLVAISLLCALVGCFS